MSWRTTLCGILGLIAAGITLVALPLLDGDPATAPSWGAWIAMIPPAVGLMLARDHKVSSEDAGLK